MKIIFIESNQVCLLREINNFLDNNPNIEIFETNEEILKENNNYKVEIKYRINGNKNN